MLEAHQIIMETSQITEEDQRKEVKLQQELLDAYRQEAAIGRLKARCLWLKEGDRNSGFFHKQAKSRKNFKIVQEIHAQDMVINDLEEIKIEATRHFSKIYSAENDIITGNEDMELIPQTIKKQENTRLIKRIVVEELKEVVGDMKDDKAPGPYGFNVNFIKACWEIVQKDLFKMVSKS